MTQYRRPVDDPQRVHGLILRAEQKSRNPVRLYAGQTTSGDRVVIAATIVGRGEKVHTRGIGAVAAVESLIEMLDRRASRKSVRKPRPPRDTSPPA